MAVIHPVFSISSIQPAELFRDRETLRPCSVKGGSMRRVFILAAFMMILASLGGCQAGMERRDWMEERDPARGITQGVAHDRDGGLERR
jgi:hypothetical protein